MNIPKGHPQDSRSDKKMRINSKYRNSIPNPALAAAIVAVVSTAAVLFDDFGPSHTSEDRSTATMISAAAISKAGAIETPSELSVSPSTFSRLLRVQ